MAETRKFITTRSQGRGVGRMTMSMPIMRCIAPQKTKRAYSEALVTLVNFCGDNVLNSWVPFLPFLLDRGARPAAADVSWQ